jgi:hypothetical protein
VALIALLFLVDSALGRRWAGAVRLSVGTVVATVPLLLYNWLIFRNPFEVSYRGHLPNFQGSGAFGVFNLTLPQLNEVYRALFSGRGLFVLTPVVLVAVIGCVLSIVGGGPLRRDGWLGLMSLVGFIAIATGVDGLGGDSPGPRYLIPMFPLLAVPLAVMWRRFPRPCTATAIAGGLTMWMAGVTAPDLPGTWATRLIHGDLATNILTGRDHRWALLITTALGLIAIGGAVYQDRAATPRATS